ncbi:Mu-like phage gp27 [Fulvimarina pelagi HTCC2506]|uniref:Mu-like phage gp27 n=1 Tax=Fulvimarina pelagi HTCC2506 TaxID=314231 RepID=Q0FYY3_9HYPH|nr:DUF3486 family protein [Fulvimarina pelagi]EAU40175.1 Mu-like phage gp27 [Fulvimarina pelagi HTCC2506]
MADRVRRGRLSSIDLLPADADGIVQWAVAELQSRERTQLDILVEMNGRLEEIGCDPISPSAFNRYSTRLAATTRRLQETRDIATAVTERLGPDKADDITIMLVEMIKSSVYSILETGQVDTQGVMFLANALKSALATQKVSADARRSAEAETRKKLDEAAKAVEVVAGEKGFSAETVEAIKARILGVVG